MSSSMLDPGWRDPGADDGRRRRRRRRDRILAGSVALALVAVVLGAWGVVSLIGSPPGFDDASSHSSFSAPFGSHPRSNAVGCSGQHGMRISGLTFKGIGHDVPAITVIGCSDVTITGNDFIDDAEPIYVKGSTNVVITGNRYRNITGPHERNGSHRGNFVQLEHSFGGRISGNEGIGGDTEDIVSVYDSGGASAAHPLVIEDNRFEGTDWSSASGSGILIGDNGGAHVVVRSNVLVNPGQVGIGVAGGSDIHIIGNTIYGAVRPYSNVGLYVWGQGVPCSSIEVAHNTIHFVKADGQPSSLWNAGNCGTVAGLATNRLDVAMNPSRYEVRL